MGYGSGYILSTKDLTIEKVDELVLACSVDMTTGRAASLWSESSRIRFWRMSLQCPIMYLPQAEQELSSFWWSCDIFWKAKNGLMQCKVEIKVFSTYCSSMFKVIL